MSGRGRETLPAKKGTGPCQNADPNNLDFTTLRYYGSENRTVSPYRHIMDRHVLPNSKPGTTRYVFGSDFTGVHNPAQTMTAVIKWDQLTFAKGTATQQGNGNIQFLYTIPPIKIDTGFGILTPKGIGQTLSGGWLRTNGLVVAGNCTSVVTPFPTVP